MAHAWHSNGGFGVPLFFALSGYLIGGLLLTETRRFGSIQVGRFLVRRGLKIYPAYFVFLFYLIAMPALKAAIAGENVASTVQNLASAYFANVFFIHNYVGPNPAGHTWSLAVEEHFYILLPFLILVFIRLKAVSCLATVCLSSIAVFTGLRVACAYIGDPYSHQLHRTMAASHLLFDSLLAGVGIRALAEFSPTLFTKLGRWRYAWIVFGFSLLAVGNLAPMPPPMFGVPFGRLFPLTTCAATALLLGVIHIQPQDFGRLRLLISPLLRLVSWIGIYSYSIYLWHVTIIGFTERVLISRLPWSTAYPSVWILSVGLIISCVVLFGFLMARIVEWPFISFRDRFFASRSFPVHLR